MERDSLYDIPEFVAKYCKGRYTEIVEYLTDKHYSILYQKSLKDPDIKLKILESEKDSQYIRCLVTRRVLPLTVMKNPMLLRAAELEYKTYNGETPISIQEARWLLVDEYPQTNNINQGNSCLELIRQHRTSYRLSLNTVVKIAYERKCNHYI